MKSLDHLIADLAPEDRAAVETRSRELIAEELTLRDLRKAKRMSQKALGQTLHMGQDSISRLERRSDMLLSTLRSYVEAMGGSLKLTVEFPDRAPVALTGLTIDDLDTVESGQTEVSDAPSAPSTQPAGVASVSALSEHLANKMLEAGDTAGVVQTLLRKSNELVPWRDLSCSHAINDRGKLIYSHSADPVLIVCGRASSLVDQAVDAISGSREPSIGLAPISCLFVR